LNTFLVKKVRSGSDLGENFRIRPDPDSQHCDKGRPDRKRKEELLTEEAEELELSLKGGSSGKEGRAQCRKGQPLQLLVAFTLEKYIAHFPEEFVLLLLLDIIPTGKYKEMNTPCMSEFKL
jgi:hypothetical protein